VAKTNNPRIDRLNARLNAQLDQGPVIGFHMRTDNAEFYRQVAVLTAMLVHDEHTLSKDDLYILKNGTKYKRQDGSVWVVLRAVNFAGYRICVGLGAAPPHTYVLDHCPDDYLATPGPVR
jgi:hypothetical protein